MILPEENSRKVALKKKKKNISLDSEEVLRKKTKLSNHLQLGDLVSKLKKPFFFLLRS